MPHMDLSDQLVTSTGLFWAAGEPATGLVMGLKSSQHVPGAIRVCVRLDRRDRSGPRLPSPTEH